MWKLKNFEINSKVVLGPMAGITFRSYREFMSRFGFGVCITEMVSDMGRCLSRVAAGNPRFPRLLPGT